MSKRLFLPRVAVASLSLVVVLAGCKRPEAPATETSPATKPAATASGDPDATVTSPPNVDTVIPFQTDKVVSRTALGADQGRDGMVLTSRSEFKPTDKIRLSMWLKESPANLATRAVWYDAKEKVVHEEQKRMDGAKTVTFEYKGKRLAPGKYQVIGYWGGNIVAEYPFTVVK